MRLHLVEVTPDGEIVWEFFNPGGMVFRAHRYPYEWFPLAARPEPTAAPRWPVWWRFCPRG